MSHMLYNIYIYKDLFAKHIHIYIYIYIRVYKVANFRDGQTGIWPGLLYIYVRIEVIPVEEEMTVTIQ